MTEDRLERLATALGVQRNGMTDDQWFEACLRVIARNMGTAP